MTGMKYLMVISAIALISCRFTRSLSKDEDCEQFNVSELALASGPRFFLILVRPQGLPERILWADDSESRASTMLDAIKRNHIAFRCYVGRPNATVQYWLTDDRRAAPQLPLGGTVALIEPNRLEAVPALEGAWQINTDHKLPFQIVVKSPETAERVIMVAQHYAFSRVTMINSHGRDTFYFGL